ncbi:MAG: hypothetical protein ACR2KQ_11550 [Actinomycetota bacterium]
MKKQILIGTILSLVLTAYAAPAGATAACSSDEALETLEVTAKATRRVYTPGETAKLKITVNRHIEGSTVSIPAENISVVSLGSTGWLPMVGAGTTDADGKVTIPLKIRKAQPTGWVDAFTFASYSYAGGPCARAEEQGSTQDARLFKISAK